MAIPGEYAVQKFHQLAGYAKRRGYGNVLEGGCPICREGSSWGRKRRLYFMVNDSHIYCHNCGWTGNPVSFIQTVENLSYKQILHEASEYDILPVDVAQEKQQFVRTSEAELLPKDSINMLDPVQREYYSKDKMFNLVMDFTNRRDLLRASNRPKTLYVSLSDYIHKNRLIIPFYDNKQVIFYQSRSVIDSDKDRPKYLSKVGADKSIFNIDNIDINLDKIFIFEGPIDACFCKNGVAVAGIQENSKSSLNEKQKHQLAKYNFFDKVWALDSQWQDRAAKLKTEKLIEQDEKVFIWPEKYGRKFKDFNDMALALDINEIPYKFILDNTYTGLKAKLLLTKC